MDTVFVNSIVVFVLSNTFILFVLILIYRQVTSEIIVKFVCHLSKKVNRVLHFDREEACKTFDDKLVIDLRKNTALMQTFHSKHTCATLACTTCK